MEEIQAFGTGLALLGILGMFFCGSPFPGRTGGRTYRTTSQVDEAERRREAALNVGAWAGFGACVIGTGVQLITALVAAFT
jgi:hypothetical protein